jgi:hypothetical protein
MICNCSDVRSHFNTYFQDSFASIIFSPFFFFFFAEKIVLIEFFVGCSV